MIDEQTLMFWNLQLQFMEMDTDHLSTIASGVLIYLPRNKRTKNAMRLIYKHFSNLGPGLTIDQHNCLATTIAAQLSGLK